MLATEGCLMEKSDGFFFFLLYDSMKIFELS